MEQYGRVRIAHDVPLLSNWKGSHATRQPYELEIAADLYDELTGGHTADLDVYDMLAAEFGGPILELACGTGRCMVPLMRRGYDVIGIDASEPMLRRLRQNLDNEPDEVRYRASYLRGDCRFYSLPIRFGMAFIAFSSFAHLLTKKDQESFVASAFEHLRPGGILAVDTFNPSLSRLAAGSETNRARVRDIDIVESVRATDLPEQLRHLVTAYYKDGSLLAQVEWSLRYVFRYELEHLLERAGFELIRLWGDHEQRPFGEATDRLFAVGRKPGRKQRAAARRATAEVKVAV